MKITIEGPSGTGKSTLANEIRAILEHKLRFGKTVIVDGSNSDVSVLPQDVVNTITLITPAWKRHYEDGCELKGRRRTQI